MTQQTQKMQRAQLMDRLDRFAPVAKTLPPGGGWARAIREALSMTQRQLAERLSISRQSVRAFKQAEADRLIWLDSLDRLAAAMCVQTALADLCADVPTRLSFSSHRLDEIAARLSHRLVAIHSFPNGNGRLSCTIADVLLVDNGAPRFSWGAANLVNEGEMRQRDL